MTEKAPITKSQYDYLRDLVLRNGNLRGMAEEQIKVSMETEQMKNYLNCSKDVASIRIDKLIEENRRIAYETVEKRKKAAAAKMNMLSEGIKDGFYQVGDDVYKVVTSKNDRRYAKRLIGDRWAYTSRAIKKIQDAGAVPLKLEEAKKYGKLYGKCLCCGRTLTDENSIALGIGPICAGKYF